MDLQKKAEELMNKPGYTRAESVSFFLRYIEKKEGKEGRKKVEEMLKELGYSLDDQKTKSMKWIKEGFSVLTVLIAKDIFNWTEKDIFEMGKFEPKSSFVVKVMIKHFVSLERSLNEVPNYWRRYYKFGSLEVAEFDKEKKYFVLRKCGYDFDPVKCPYHAGFIFTMAQLAMKEEDISVKETKCIYNGDDYHEYTVTWK